MSDPFGSDDIDFDLDKFLEGALPGVLARCHVARPCSVNLNYRQASSTTRTLLQGLKPRVLCTDEAFATQSREMIAVSGVVVACR